MQPTAPTASGRAWNHTPISPRPSGFTPPSRDGIRRIEFVMGMPIVFEVCDPEVEPGEVQAAIDWLHWVDATFSTYRRDSEISRLNHGELTPDGLHPDVVAILEHCERLRTLTGGYFDIRAPYAGEPDAPDRRARAGAGPDVGRGLPGSVEPSGLVKGWAVARVVERLCHAGAVNLCVNAGGDLIACGHPDGDDAWRIGIQHPRSSRDIALTLAVRDRAIATSGTYVRGEHIVDPRGRLAPAGLLSVTVTGPDLPTADAFATAAFAMGAQRGAAWCASIEGYEAILICEDDTVLTTPGIDDLRV